MFFLKFLWDGKQDKVKRTEIINDFAEGGLKMLDFNRALKAKWVQRYLDPHNRGKWQLFVESSLIDHNINLLLQGNLNSEDADSLGIEEPFTKELIETWSLVNFLKNIFPISAKHQFGTTLLYVLTTSLSITVTGPRLVFTSYVTFWESIHNFYLLILSRKSLR